MIVFYYLNQDKQRFLEFLKRGDFTVYTEIPLGIEGEILFSRVSKFPPADDKYAVLADILPSSEEDVTIVEWEKVQLLPSLDISLVHYNGLFVRTSGLSAENFRLQPFFKNILNILNDIQLEDREKFFKENPTIFFPDIFTGPSSLVKNFSNRIFEARKRIPYTNPMDLILFNSEIHK